MKPTSVKKVNKKKSNINMIRKVNKERQAFKKSNIAPNQKKGKQMRQKSCRKDDLARNLSCIDKKNEIAMKRNPGQNIEKVDIKNGMNKVIKEKNGLKRNVVKAVKASNAFSTQETVKQTKQFCQKEDLGPNKNTLFRCFERKIQRAVTALENALLILPQTSKVHKTDSKLNEDTTSNYEICENGLGEDVNKQEEASMSITE